MDVPTPGPGTTGAKVTYAAVVAAAAIVVFAVIWLTTSDVIWGVLGAALAVIAMRAVLGMIGITNPFRRA